MQHQLRIWYAPNKTVSHYRLSPNGIAPAELMLKHQPHSHLDSIVPNSDERERQSTAAEAED